VFPNGGALFGCELYALISPASANHSGYQYRSAIFGGRDVDFFRFLGGISSSGTPKNRREKSFTVLHSFTAPFDYRAVFISVAFSHERHL
jgi:hypothetical protein